MTGLYLHVPFCKQKCAYCSFYSGNFDYKEEYLSAVIRSVKYFGAKTAQTVSTVYIGGGTPSTLRPHDFELIFGEIYKSFTVQADAEITVECNPESVSNELICALKSLGVNRISMGVQSLVDSELKIIGRLHDAECARIAVQTVKANGIDNISCDLIFGLPTQTVDSLKTSISGLLALDIPHISCYNLQLEKGTRLYSEGVCLPDEGVQEQMYFNVCDMLKSAGYRHYEISNYCKDGKYSRHNSSYWDGTDYIGIGPSAHSKIGEYRYSFDADIKKFCSKTDFTFDTCEKITDADFETLMLGLRTDRGAKLIDGKEKFVEKLVQNGMANVVGDRLVLTDKGFYLSNSIITTLGENL